MSGPRLSVVGDPRRPAIGDRPIVVLEAGRLPWKIDEAEGAILRNYAHWGLYQRAGGLFRVARAGTPEKQEPIKRPAEAIILRQATAPMIQDIFGRAIRFEKGGGDITDCPVKVANLFLSRAGLWRLPVLNAIISAPIVRPDGTLLTENGFDESTGLLLESSIDCSLIPSCPNQDDAKAAVGLLLKPFAQFPLDPAGRSVLVSAILSGVQRRLLVTTPAHAFDATTQGSGKTLLADSVSLIVSGNCCTSMSANSDEEELRKKLVSVLIANDPIVSLDNVTRPLQSDALATILTVSTYSDRLLGASQKVWVPTNALFFVTGNNLSFSRDLPSRVMVARLEPDVERPEERSFNISNLRAYILENRSQLVCAAITILLGFFVAGRPSQGVKPLGRFEQWSHEIREAIIWAGLADPCETRESVIASDPDRDATLALFTEWTRVANGNSVTLSDLISNAATDKTLESVMIEIASDYKNPGQINARRLGAWCRDRVGRVVGEFKLTKESDTRKGFTRWKVLQIETKAPNDPAKEEIEKEI